jgi:hypothetical protein
LTPYWSNIHISQPDGMLFGGFSNPILLTNGELSVASRCAISSIAWEFPTSLAWMPACT